MVKIYFKGTHYDTDNENDNIILKGWYNSSVMNKNELVIALGLALIKEEKIALQK